MSWYLMTEEKTKTIIETLLERLEDEVTLRRWHLVALFCLGVGLGFLVT